MSYEVPDILSSRIAAKRCILLIGSGLSHHIAGYPTWEELMREVAQKFRERSSLLEDLSSVSDVDPLEFFEYLAKHPHIGEAELKTFIKHLLAPKPETSSHPILRIISRIPWAAIITTNYDKLIEDSLWENRIQFNHIEVEEDIASIDPSQIQLVKMHGTIGGDIVLTWKDYENYFLSRPTFRVYLTSLFAQYSILFVGFSLQDPNFRQIYSFVHTTLGRFQNPSFSVVRKVGEMTRSIWRHRNLEFIEIGSYDNLLCWFQDLRAKADAIIGSDPELIGWQASSQYLRSEAVEKLSAAHTLKEANHQYMVNIQEPDYQKFKAHWERTLYEPLRQEVKKQLGTGTKLRMAYAAPGYRAPAISASTFNYLDELLLLDIDEGILDAAKKFLQQHFKTKIRNLLTLEIDLLGSLAEKFYSLCIEAMDPERLKSQWLGEFPSYVAASLQEITDSHVIEIPSSLAGRYDLVYSEMLASYCGLPAYIMAESKLFNYLITTEQDEEQARNRYRQLVTFLRRAWVTFNDLSYRLQLIVLAKLARPGGKILIATDTVKVFDHPYEGLPPIEAFSKPLNKDLPNEVSVLTYAQNNLN